MQHTTPIRLFFLAFYLFELLLEIGDIFSQSFLNWKMQVQRY